MVGSKGKEVLGSNSSMAMSSSWISMFEGRSSDESLRTAGRGRGGGVVDPPVGRGSEVPRSTSEEGSRRRVEGVNLFAKDARVSTPPLLLK